MSIDVKPITTSREFVRAESVAHSSGKGRSATSSLIVILVILIPVLWVPGVIYAVIQLSKAKRQAGGRARALREFATTNRFQYAESGLHHPGKTNEGQATDDTYTLDLPYGTYKICRNYTISGRLHNTAFEYFHCDLQQPVRHSEGAETAIGTGMIIFTVKVPVSLPRLFVDAKYNNTSLFSFTANNFATRQDYILEGNFSHYFDVTAEDNDHINVLSILTPDVMSVLIDNRHYDVWLSGTQLQLLRPGTEIDYFGGIPAVFREAEVLLESIDRIARQMRARARQ